MLWHEAKVPAAAIWALGVTQIVGYGTLYYAFPILAPAMASDLGLSQSAVFGALSVALFLGSLAAPYAGKLADRFGAARVMTAGSAAAALALAACALAPEAASFVAALVAAELAACFVLYATAFAAIVQIGPAGAQRSITHLTLIAGFASTLFWPLTTLLHGTLAWRQVFLIFAGLNLALCLPLHAWLMRQARHRRLSGAAAPTGPDIEASPPADPRLRKKLFLLMLAGFAVEGFVLSAILIHMVPLIGAVGLGAAGVAVAALYGPSQVASRLVNMVFGGRLRQSTLAVISTILITIGLGVFLVAPPSIPVAAGFVILFGLGGGLMSIVGGTLPLEVFGRAGYGGNVGWMSGARQFSSAFAPFLLALMLEQGTVNASIGIVTFVALVGVAGFAAIAVLQRRNLSGPA